MARAHWLNADFDLSFRPSGFPSDYQRQVDELSLHGLMAGEPEDRVLVDVILPPDFLSVLEASGLPLARPIQRADADPEDDFAPWGWNARAAAMARTFRRPAFHPPVEVVAKVNGRQFSHDLERRLDGDSIALGTVTDLGSVVALAAKAGDVLVKAEHSNAGVGHRRIRRPELTATDRRWLIATLDQGPVVVERWLERTADLCAVYDVDDDGAARNLAVHEAIHTADGAFLGALYGDDAAAHPWRDAIERSAAQVAAAVHAAGFTGPVCQDALVWSDDGRPRVRPLVEINARRHVSEGWSRLGRLVGGVVYGRFFAARKFRLPESYEAFQRALGGDAWRTAERRGVVPTSPLWFQDGDERRRPFKIGVALCGDSRAEVMAMEERFRDRFEAGR
jgi:hypothetical protein